eukprot:SAG11_NODE_324_length_10739_cov_86.975752_1_plen_100_part_00
MQRHCPVLRDAALLQRHCPVLRDAALLRLLQRHCPVVCDARSLLSRQVVSSSLLLLLLQVRLPFQVRHVLLDHLLRYRLLGPHRLFCRQLQGAPPDLDV